MADATAGDAQAARSSLASMVYDPKARGIFFQVLIFGLLLLGLYLIINNTLVNLEQLNKKSGFGFLSQTTGFAIFDTLGTWAVGYTPGESTYWDVFLVGAINTVWVAVFSIVLSTILGFVIGVMRLSKNVILRSVATVYIEVLRNIPLLLQIFFWIALLTGIAPGKRDDPISIFGVFFFDSSGIRGPYPISLEGAGVFYASILAGVIAAFAIGKWAKSRQDATGQQFPSFWVGLGVIIFLPVVVFYAMGQPIELEWPNRGNFGFRPGIGSFIEISFVALWLSLGTYTASFIAEIVRAGILSVSHGQTEGAQALGISANVTLNKVIIPQAMRVIIPPLTSQYLNVTKNSSLAAAIGFPDVVATFSGTALNQVGQEIEMIFMMMMVYLFFSITTAIFMNWYNARKRLVER